jgi:UDP-2,3-diacylglucosamine pyrophosphatase LpxH
LLNFVQERHAEQAFDGIFVTGDIAYSGKAAEYELATEFFTELIDRTHLPKSRIVVVPGNHDIDRLRVQWLSRTPNDQEQIDAYFAPEKPKIHITEGQISFASWHDGFFSDSTAFSLDSTCSTPIIWKLESGSVGLIRINTAVFSSGEHDHNHLVVGRRCLTEAARAMQKLAPDLRFALMHHPVDWLWEGEQDAIQALLSDNFDCVLRGHLHRNDIRQSVGPIEQGIRLAAGAAYQTERYPNMLWVAELVDGLLKVEPVRYTSSPRPVWRTDLSLAPKSADGKLEFHMPFSNPSKVGDASDAAKDASTEKEGENVSTAIAATKVVGVNLPTENLLVTPRDELLYVEPRLKSKSQEQSFEDSASVSDITIQQIATSASSYIIESSPEYGATTLCSRLRNEILAGGMACTSANSRNLPAYKAKLIKNFPGVQEGAGGTLILDDFSISEHQRLFREIKGLKLFSRFILMSVPRASFERVSDNSTEDFKSFEVGFHWQISRADIRTLAGKMFDSSDDDFVSSLVNKVYGELLALRIPLTPGNVIMYLRVLLREENFVPVNRVHIVNQYIEELLRRSSDIYRESFTAKNKIEVLSAFAHSLYKEKRWNFSDSDWISFCSAYQAQTLRSFDVRALQDECERARVFVRYENSLAFKYNFYFSFFAGKYIASKSAELEEFLSSDSYFDLNYAVEVISGLSLDNTRLVERLCDRLEGLISEFRREYMPEDFDPHAGLEWEPNRPADRELWQSVQKGIGEGPSSAEVVDAEKTNLLSEIRTADQSVQYRTMVELESAIFSIRFLLADALKNSDSIAGELKCRAVMDIYQVDLIVMQVGIMLSRVIAASRLVQWGGIAFLNESSDKYEELPEECHGWILSELPRVIARDGSENIGSQKLAPVFHYIEERLPTGGFSRILNFASVIAAKGDNWVDVAERTIREVPRDRFYMRVMLKLLLGNYKTEVSSIRDRRGLKRLISLVYTKRQFGTNSPGEKALAKVTAALEGSGTFELPTTMDKPEE